jgi:hypothetical protein
LERDPVGIRRRAIKNVDDVLPPHVFHVESELAARSK